MARYIDADILRKNEIARCHCVPCVGSNDNNYKDLDEVLNDCPTADVVPKSEVARCKDCVYFQPDFVLTNNGERRPYTDEEKNSSLGMVTGDVGVNCGSRCERFDYWDDNRFPVWFQDNDYCSYFKKKYMEDKG